jgi:4-amino-4-deoxy-L-arabinose transferase-like glycosyltransferase
MPQALYVLLGAALTVAACLGCGRFLVRRWRLPLYRQEEPALSFLLGAAVVSLIVFALATAHLLYKPVLLAMLALLVWLGRRRPQLPPLPPVGARWSVFAAVVTAPFALLYFCHAMAPEMSPDGSAYHLGLVAKYYRDRGFSAITTNMYANLSHAVDLLYLPAFAIGRHSAAALTHLAFLPALTWLVFCYGRRYGFPLAGLVAAGFVFFSPVVGIDAASAYIDVAVAAILFGVYYLTQVWDQTRFPKLLWALGMLVGFAFGAKYTAFVGAVYAGLYLLWRRHPRGIAVVAVVAALWAAPWLVKNALILGNPVSPFGNRLFPNPYIHVSFEEEYAERMRRYELPNRWWIPWEVTVRGERLNGLVGPVFLLAPFAFLAWRARHGRRLLFATALFGAVYATNIGTRFLIPALPFLSLAMAQGFARSPRLAVFLVVAHAVTAWPPVLSTYCDRYAWRLDRILWKQALRLETEHGYLDRKWPNYSVARLIEAKVPPGGKVLTFNQTGEAYTTRDILVVYQAAFNANLGGILLTPLIPQYQPLRWLEFRFPPLKARLLRVVQTASNSPDHFTVNEMRIFHGARELERAPEWRLRAYPYGWGVREAFDNSRLTRWGSWQKIFPGMFIEVDLGTPQAVDRVAIEASHDESAIRVKLEIEDAAGNWTTIDEPREIEIAPPLGMRREATQLLLDRGVGYLLLHQNDFLSPDIEARPDRWGLVKLGESWGFRLYAIQPDTP